jgi:hypothetical protein
MSNADEVGLAYVEESTWGTKEPGNPTMQDLRFTGESLAQTTETVTSAEIRSDRQRTGLIRTNVGAGGDINFELSYGSYDEFMGAALMVADPSTWTALVTDTQTTFAMVNATNSIDDSASGFVVAGFTAGMWIRVSGFTGDTSNNRIWKVESVAAGSMVLSGGSVVDDAEGESVTILQGASILNGTTVTSYSIERSYEDLANEFAVYAGMTVNGMSLNIATGAIITGSFTFMGVDEESLAATMGDGSNTAANTNEVMNAVDHVTYILEGGTNASATAVTISMTNNLRPRNQIANLGPVSVGSGKIDVTGTIQMYFATKTLMDKYLNMTETSMALVITDTAGNDYVIDLPAIKFSSGQRVAGGENTDIIADMAFQGYMEATELKTMRIQKFAA